MICHGVGIFCAYCRNSVLAEFEIIFCSFGEKVC